LKMKDGLTRDIAQQLLFDAIQSRLPSQEARHIIEGRARVDAGQIVPKFPVGTDLRALVV
jgi:hypothetical protein